MGYWYGRDASLVTIIVFAGHDGLKKRFEGAEELSLGR